MDQLKVVSISGHRVLTTAQLAESYGADSDRITKNFNRNKERYQNGKHFILLEGNELKEFRATSQIDLLPNVHRLYLWTEKGAWLHAKSLNTDQAWDAYETLVDEYYRIQSQVRVLSQREQLMASMQLTLETAQEVEEIKGKVEQLEDKVDNQMTLDYGMQRRLQRAVGERVYKLSDDGQERPRLFRELYREIKDRFGVASYKDVRRKDLQSAVSYVEAWIPRRAA